jgi:hypothetical protein
MLLMPTSKGASDRGLEHFCRYVSAEMGGLCLRSPRTGGRELHTIVQFVGMPFMCEGTVLCTNCMHASPGVLDMHIGRQ